MTEMFTTIFPEYLVQSIGWTIIHSLWQSAIVALALKGIFLLSTNKRSKINYFASFFSLVIILILSINTFKTEFNHFRQNHINESINLTFNDNFAAENTIIQQTDNSVVNTDKFSFNDSLNNLIPILFLLWFFGFIIRSISSFISFLHTSKLKKSGLEITDKSLLSIFRKMSKKLELSASIRIMLSQKVKVPSVIGYLKPVVLLPAEILSSIPKDQLEIIIAHELAHIYRSDYLLNLIQEIIEVIFFFNPAIWWISYKTREYREHCCDDIALELTGNKSILAKALVNIAESSDATENLILTFGKNNNQLLGRINRMNNQKHKKVNSVAGSLILLLTAFFLIAAAKSDLTESENNVANFRELDSPYFEANYSIDNPEKLIFYKKLKGKRVKWEVEFDKHQNIVSLNIDGDEIDSEDFDKYKDTIYDKMDDTNYDDWNVDFDSEKFSHEMEELKESIGNININFDSEAFEESMKTLSESLEDMEINININEEQLKVNLEEAAEALENIHINIDSDKLRESIENIKIEFDSEEFEESMQKLNEKLKDLDIDMSALVVEMEKLTSFLDEVREELVDDDIIDNKDEDFSMLLNEDEFVVNHEKQSSSLHRKYKQIYEKHYDKKLTSDIRID